MRMKLKPSLLALFTVAFFSFVNVDGGNILVWPTEGSHWINLRPVLKTLIDRGHNLTILVPSASIYMSPRDLSPFNLLHFNTSVSKKDIMDFLKEYLDFAMNESSRLNLLQKNVRFYNLFSRRQYLLLEFCNGVLKSPSVLAELSRINLDTVLVDTLYPCGELLAEHLALPFVLTHRFSYAHSVERLCGQIPSPPSYVPGALSQLTDKMSFTEKIMNILFYITQDTMTCSLWKKYDDYYSEYLGSHWINLKPVLETLMDRGHNVTVLIPNATWYMDSSEQPRYSVLRFTMSMTVKDLDDFMEEYLQFSMYESHRMNVLQKHISLYELLSKDQDFMLKYCDGVLKSPEIMGKINEESLDTILADPLYPCAELLAEVLNVPFIYTFRFSMAHTVERMCGQLPSPPSYAPGTMSELTDKMSFSERLMSLLFYLTQDAMALCLWKKYDDYYIEYLGRPTSYCELMGKADIWLIRTYWDFEYPRPLLPNFKYVGGMHCRPAKPLPEDLEEFVQSSGDDGIVVFSLGSFIRNITKEKSNLIASALGQIPQKVIWKYGGEKPVTLAPNTRIYDWIPQNDLLGHPKTRVFLTHGGTNGVYEAIYHGVPMVGIPIFGDQPDNMVHMKAKGAAEFLNLNNMKMQDLVDTLKTVISDPSYKDSALRLSRIHHDRPVKALDEAVFWIEYVMRNKGARHLRVAAHNLTWYQYLCLDVLFFLISVTTLIFVIIMKSCSLCYRKCCRTQTHKYHKNKAE
ncbi:UDP-glucuronosyltransferase 2C1-like isoform X2 [Hoplias malabaricus]|uniref:UDP-glucuronosyltransferase 2C1-like isoform X2 n=1 Tax=Hoplias malabaricus TaxID=27720 RepID=UPI003462B7B3